jgi:hypothetical protein
MSASLSVGEILAGTYETRVFPERLSPWDRRRPRRPSSQSELNKLAPSTVTAARWKLLAEPLSSCQDVGGVNTASRGGHHAYDRSGGEAGAQAVGPGAGGAARRRPGRAEPDRQAVGPAQAYPTDFERSLSGDRGQHSFSSDRFSRVPGRSASCPARGFRGNLPVL